MVAATRSWKGGSLGTDQGRWGVASDWSGGQVPGPGDADLVNGIDNAGIGHIGEVITFPAGAGYTAIYLFPEPPLGTALNHPEQLQGYDIVSQTIALNGTAGPPELWLQATTLAHDTVNVTGTAVLQSYLNNTLAGGAINIGSRTQTGVLQFQLVGADTAGATLPGQVPATSLSGTTTIGRGSALRIIALTGDGEPPADFRNHGTIAVQPGGTLFIDDTDGSGAITGADHNTTFLNAGRLRVDGEAGVTTSATVTAQTAGGGTIDVAGGGGPRSATTLTLNGNVTNENIVVDDGTVAINDAQLVNGDPSLQGFAVNGGSFIFGPAGGTLLLHQPPLTTLQFVDGGLDMEQRPDGQHPFTTPIFGFGAGDVIGLVHGDQGGSYFTEWNAASHLLSVEFAPSIAGHPAGVLGQYTLAGSYAASGFHLTGDAQTGSLSLTYAGPRG